jgi:hypothetical protein
MRSLAAPADYQLLSNRLAAVTPGDQSHWGQMNVHQMMCHLADAIRVPLGEKHVSERNSLFERTLMKWGAFWVPTSWPKNVPTCPELDQCRLGIPDGDFATLQADTLEQLIRLHNANVEGMRHPFLGSLTQTEWMRWGWLHTDHHLRQFGR